MNIKKNGKRLIGEYALKSAVADCAVWSETTDLLARSGVMLA